VNQGRQYAASDVGGLDWMVGFDQEDRATNRTDRNGVGVVITYDNLGRARTRTYPDNGVEGMGYSASGLIAYTNQIGASNFMAYDAAGRKTFETNANNELNQYTYSAAGDLLTLTDGKGHVTTWQYDQYGRLTNKLDQTSLNILRYQYDADDRLTNRWSNAKGATTYAFDAAGNLTNIAYPSGTASVTLSYDPLNRVTNMVDGVGTTAYTYDAAGQLLTEDGPFASDTVTNTYANRLRVALSLQQPTGAWTNGFGYDSARRLTAVASPAGVFTNQYITGVAGGSGYSSHLLQNVFLPNGSEITNYFDVVARLLETDLRKSDGTVLDSYDYIYNAANQRTNLTRADASTVGYRYDNIGQLTVSASSVTSENRGYYYDAAWNLNRRTNNGVVGTFIVDNKNELTNGPSPVNKLTCDNNGNTITSHGGKWVYSYDAENRLVQWFSYASSPSAPANGDLFTQFVYDGIGRLRERIEYVWNNTSQFSQQGGAPPPSGGGTTYWQWSSETHYIYDGMRVIQERDTNNTPTVSYTRGNDRSGTLQGAGGIGGLLARSDGYSSGDWTDHDYYFADGNGNVTYLVNSSQALAASYRYDPFGNLISSSGTLASANVYRFSSKEIHVNSGMYYYLYRFYDPNLQRWMNRDPIGDLGFVTLTERVPVRGAIDPNLFLFVRNKPVTAIDALGLTLYYCTVPTKGFPLFGLGRHGYLWNDTTGDECGQESSCGSGPTSSNNGGPGPKDTNPTRDGRVCTPIDGSQGADASNAALMAWCHQHANSGGWFPGVNDCHNVVNKCLKHGDLGGVDPGRFHPQPAFSPIPGLSPAP
jgi:RHS repeat-associated protein